MRALLRKTVDGLAQGRRESVCKISIGFMTEIHALLEQIFLCREGVRFTAHFSSQRHYSSVEFHLPNFIRKNFAYEKKRDAK
jgi:hypothetical protein